MVFGFGLYFVFLLHYWIVEEEKHLVENRPVQVEKCHIKPVRLCEHVSGGKVLGNGRCSTATNGEKLSQRCG